MTVTFFDKKRETYCNVENVEQIYSEYDKINGRYTEVWTLLTLDRKVYTFKKKDFPIHRILP